MNYEAVIGLEVHVQIRTNSKVFSRVAAGYGQPENTLTDPVILALPGALPVMNKAALDAIIKAGLLLGCDIVPEPAPDMVVGGSVRLHPRFRDLPWPARVKRNLACEPIEPQPGQWLADPGVSWCGDDFPELYP